LTVNDGSRDHIKRVLAEYDEWAARADKILEAKKAALIHHTMRCGVYDGKPCTCGMVD